MTKKEIHTPRKLNIPTNGNKLLSKVLDSVNESEEIRAYWRVINVNAINRRGMSDHGPIHFQIVANSALRILRLLHKHNIAPAVVSDFDLTYEHAEVVVFLASIFHDLGMVMDREGHEGYSLIIAQDLLAKVLEFMPVTERIIVSSEVLHAIISHRSGGRPMTSEAGVVRVADALDMNKGRSRISYEAGNVNIYSISDVSIAGVELAEGKDKPVRITITMTNSAGIFQVDELLKKKLSGSGIEQYCEVKAVIPGKTEEKLLDEIILFPR